MRTWLVLKAALRSLQRAPLRSALTSLGIIVGVSAVVTTTSIGNGARKEIESALEKPESRTIHLIAAPQTLSLGSVGVLPRTDQLRTEDYNAIRASVPHISAISPRLYVATATARANGRVQNVVVEGIDVGGFQTVPRTLIAGALFSSEDVRKAANVCVISESLAGRLFPNERRGERTLRLNDATFTVLGIVDDATSYNLAMFRTNDWHVYVPFTSTLQRLEPSAQMTISAQVDDIEYVPEVQQGISDIMEQHRGGRKSDFRTSAAFESIKTRADGSRIVARLLAATGAIALIVGGIGIMNIMLVSVSERTREIGVRMAVGTRRRHILGQFLVEAVAISALGGALGVAAGWAASWFATRLNGWPTVVDPKAILLALACSIGVGIFFGYFPAKRAGELNPVEALRTEH